MGKTLLIHCCHYFLRTPTDQSPLTTRTHVRSHMRDPTPTLKFLSSNIITINSHRIQHPRRLFLVNGRFQSKSMATKLEESVVKDTGNDEKKGNEEEKLAKETPPPPPEKPEPGDCCGSGCVRCVWDVYYEELEAYNKLYNSDSKKSRA